MNKDGKAMNKKKQIDCIELEVPKNTSLEEMIPLLWKAFNLKPTIKIIGTKGYVHCIEIQLETTNKVKLLNWRGGFKIWRIPKFDILLTDDQEFPF